jgi:predicted MFS family arabinose efflux permease
MQNRQSMLSRRLGGSLAEVTATVLGLTSTLGILGIVPLFMGGYVDGYHQSLRQASEIVSLEVAVAILTSLWISSKLSNVSLRRICLAGALLGGVSYCLGAALAGFWALCICRIVSGTGIGLIAAAVNASVARAKEPEKLYASSLTLYAGLETAKLFLLPELYGARGYWTLFVSVGLLFFATAGASSGLSRPAAPPAHLAGVSTKKSLSWIFAPRVGAMLFGYILMWIAFSMIWAFAERKAVSLSMTPGATGATLAAANVVGMLGSLVASQLGVRLGRLIPILAGSLTLGSCFYLIGSTPFAAVYVGSIIMYGVAYFFLLPFVLGLAVQLDREGRVTVVNSMMPWVAHLVSPLLGAALLARGTFAAMGVISAVLMVIAAGFVLSAGMKLTPLQAEAAAAR